MTNFNTKTATANKITNPGRSFSNECLSGKEI